MKEKRAERRPPSRRHPSGRGARVALLPIAISLLFVLGAGVVLYPSAASWITQAQQSAILEKYASQVDSVPAPKRNDAVIAAHAYNASLTGGALLGANRNVPDAEGPGAPDTAGAPSYASLLDANGTGLMARLRIPSIAADLPIYHGTSDEVLREGVGHLEGTALPVGGVGTHAVLTGHRGLADAELFTRLNEVAVGDTFTIEVFGEVLTYRVRETKVVEPADTETLFPVPDEDLVTLVTCTPLGINTQRILVTGERVTPTPIEDVKAAGKTPDVPGFPWWAVIFGAVIIAAIVYAWVMSRPRRAPQPSLTSPSTPARP